MKILVRLFLVGCGIWALAVGEIMLAWWGIWHVPLKRDPELDVGRLFRVQRGVLPDGWGMREPRLWVGEKTKGRWAGKVSFQYGEDPRVYLWEEVHVFPSVWTARVAGAPSRAGRVAGRGVVPAGWGYAPAGAEEFRLGCAGDGVKEAVRRCSVRMRYEEYAFVLWVPIGKHFTLEDLQRFLEVTDREMGAFLEGSRLRVGLRRVPEEVKGWRREEW